MLKRPLFYASFLFSSMVGFSANGYAADELPDLGASALTVLSIEKEQQLGEVIFNEFQGYSQILQDPLITEYINSLGNRLVAHAEGVRFPFRFFAVDSPTINAFAIYGGYIGLHTGLISDAQTESQLASVIGHEIAHVTQRHLARRKQASQQQSTLTLAGVVGSMLMAVVSPQLLMASLMATAAGSQQSMLNYTRGNEQEADNIGMNILASAGYDPYGAAEMFGIMHEQSRFSTKPPPFLVTHPLEESRITDARLRAQQFERRFYPDSLDFLLVNARIKARYIFTKEDAVARFEEMVDKNRGNKLFAAKYGLALALLRDDQAQKAHKILVDLDKQSANNLFILDTLSDIAVELKQTEKLLPKLEYAYKLRPNNSVVTLNYANVLLESNKPEEAAQLLEYYLIKKPKDFIGTSLLKLAYKQAKNTTKYHVVSAQLYALSSNYTNAIQSIDRALSSMPLELDSEIRRLDALKIKYRSRQKYVKKIKETM